jgi:hypothetical protein
MNTECDERNAAALSASFSAEIMGGPDKPGHVDL